MLNELPRSVSGKAKAALHEIWMAPTRAQATAAFDALLQSHRARCPKATNKLAKDREALFAFYDFPAEHWMHLRTKSRAGFLGLAFKVVQEAEKSRRRSRGIERIADLLAGTVFKGSVPTPDNPSERQQMTA